MLSPVCFTVFEYKTITLRSLVKNIYTAFLKII